MLHCALAARNICPGGHLARLGNHVGVVHLGLGAQVGVSFSVRQLLAGPTQLLSALEAALLRNVVAARPDLLLKKQNAPSNTLNQACRDRIHLESRYEISN